MANIEALERHVTDTIKEWEMKLGAINTELRLYYPAVSLEELLGLPRECEKEKLQVALNEFCSAVQPRLGKILVSGEERICLTVSPEGCAYVKNLPDPPFLRDLLAIMTEPAAGLAQVQALFEEYAKRAGSAVCEQEDQQDGIGRVFYFADERIDPYVYCVSQDEFGLTYHRFDRRDFAHLTDEHETDSKAFL